MEQYTGLLFPILLLVIFYFLLIRPQRKKDKQIREMRSNLKVGDQITTIGGIYGKIVKVKEDILTIEVGSDKIKLNVAKWSVGNVEDK
ncbi:preprotein translocase subunit YajC [Dethiothermospora halolimnae]|uniref:preprotein translocase subunit YajC n=1 Tax=Dethiothermospora halolimnae TaxID=3114390 RepID=UPI003CCB8BA0